jgi:RNA-directed DNA polymerase
LRWEIYSQNFKNAAKERDLDSKYINKCLKYAKILYDKKLPIIYDQKHLSYLVGYKYDYLLRVSNEPDLFYRIYKIKKKNGGRRQIEEPLPSLKEIQRWILDNILYKCDFGRFAKAFVPKRSIKENARFHKKQPKVLSLDIKNFFPSIKSKRIFGIFISLGYRKSVATILTNLCVYKKRLPQGAPTSPALSNLIAKHIDVRISAYARKRGLRYTRYADDLTFSGDFNPGALFKFVDTVLRENNFRINQKKTRLMEPHQRQEVTGIVVNEKLQAPINIRKKLRADTYYINKYGLESHLAQRKIKKAHYLEHLRGIANFILFLNAEDKDAKNAISLIDKHIHFES